MTVTQSFKSCPPYPLSFNSGATSHCVGAVIIHLRLYAVPATKATAVAQGSQVWQVEYPHDNCWHDFLQQQQQQHLDLLTAVEFFLWLKALQTAVKLSLLLSRDFNVVGVTGFGLSSSSLADV